MPLDRSLLLELTHLRDPLGVLFVCVDARPNELEASSLAVRNALNELAERARSEGSRECRMAVTERVRALEPILADLTSVSAPGRGRALFAPVQGGEPPSDPSSPPWKRGGRPVSSRSRAPAFGPSSGGWATLKSLLTSGLRTKLTAGG